jgi:hypothetical protein
MSLRSRCAGPIIVPFIGEAMSRHGGCRWISTQSLLRKGYGTKPAFTVPPRMETSPRRRQARQQSNSQRTAALDPSGPPTNDIVETI